MDGNPLFSKKKMLLPCLVVAFFLCLLSTASAQLLHLDPLPWTAPPDSLSRQALEVQIDRFQDDKFGWSGNRLLLTVVLPGGDSGTYFVRMPHVNFDYGEVSLFNRWSWIRGEETDPSWPGESRTASFGQLEVGSVGNVTLPYIGPSQYGLALGLPTGSDRIFPLSSTSLPFRVELRKRMALGTMNDIGFTAGYLMHMGSGKGILDDSAFPSGSHAAIQVTKRWDKNKKLILSYDIESRDGRKSQLLGVQAWMPWTDAGRLGFSAARQLQGSLDRFAKWQFSIIWRFDSADHLPGVELESEVESRSSRQSPGGRK
jgi:hypothetical protein